MSDEFAEHRQHPRVSFFSPSNERGLLPDWAFRKVEFNKAPAGLVMNISDGGLQVLISAADDFSAERHDVVLLLGEEGEDSVTWFNGIVENGLEAAAGRLWQPARAALRQAQLDSRKVPAELQGRTGHQCLAALRTDAREGLRPLAYL
ncbi:hypothetical protein ABT392_15185 [Paucibacter sp. JuS9]|uniref:hypothetical protein n=1 Tax=Paucibacter sp. JuS9 TaxID=3228748 RepID=UPI003756E036